MQSKWYQELSKASGIVMAHQLQMVERVIRNKKYKVDINRGIISFGLKKYKIQVLGTESNETNSWLWGWANDVFPDHSLKVAKAIREKGKELNLEALYTEKFEITEQFNGNTISILSCELADEEVCFYPIPTGKGTLYVLILGLPDDVYGEIDYGVFIEVILSVVKNLYVDHKVLVESMLKKNGITYRREGNSIIADFEINIKIDYERSDEFWRISNIEYI